MQETLLNNVTIEQLMALLGAIGTVASILGAVLPNHWPITQLLTKYFADPRGVRKVPTKNEVAATVLRRAYSQEDELTPVEPAIARRKSDPPPPDTLR
jgi:hypothetical protein